MRGSNLTIMGLEFQFILLSSTFFLSVLARNVFERQPCDVPCGYRCGLKGDTCCVTPNGGTNLCGYGTTCCLYGCCNFGSACQSNGTCVATNTTISRNQTIPTSSVRISLENSRTDTPAISVAESTTVSRSQTITTASWVGIPPPHTLTHTSATKVTRTTTESGSQTIIFTSTIGVPVSSTNVESPSAQTATKVTRTTTESGSQTIIITSTIGVPVSSTNVESPSAQTATKVTRTTTESGSQTITITSTIGVPVSSTNTKSPSAQTATLPGDQTFTSQSGRLVWGTNTVTVPDGITSSVIITKNGETFTFEPSQTQPPPGESTESLPDGVTVTFSSDLLIWGSNTVTVPQSLTAPVTLTTDGETFPFQPTGQLRPTETVPVLTETLSGGVILISSSMFLSWGTNTLVIPTGLTTVEVVTIHGKTFTFVPPTDIGTPTSTSAFSAPTSTAVLITYTTWPSVVSILPVTTSVHQPQASHKHPVIPCTAWFFFVCISWHLNIGGWQLPLLPPGVYPPGPPPGFEFPAGITISGILPPWPRITIGNDGVPTYTSEPTSCETESATMFLTTTSFGVSAKHTTATQVLSTSSIIVGCDTGDRSSDTTTTSVCPTTATTCSETLVIALSVDDTYAMPTEAFDTTDALATSVYNFVMSFWSAQDAAETSATFATVTTTSSTAMTTSSSTTRGAPTQTLTAPWSLSIYNTSCDIALSNSLFRNFSFYSLEGFDRQSPDEPCVPLQGGQQPSPQQSYSCEFQPEGGFNNSVSCSAGTFNTPTSFRIFNGNCTIFDGEYCTGNFNSIASNDSSGCIDYKDTTDLPETWLSMRCFADPAPPSFAMRRNIQSDVDDMREGHVPRLNVSLTAT